MKCEKCNIEHDGKYASGRFCSIKCARGFSTSLKRQEINMRVSQKLQISFIDEFTDVEFSNIVANATSWNNLVKFPRTNRTLAYVQNRSRILQLNTEHFWRRGVASDWLCFRPGENRGNIRYWLLKSGRKYECELCGLEPIWRGQKLTLQLDHIDGNNANHSIENLRFLCPNCHSQTLTFSWKNVKRKEL